MIDSTGPSHNEKVPCFLCAGNDLEFEVYKPEHGHAGEPLDLPYCMAPHSGWGDIRGKNFQGAKFFTIKPYSEADDLEKDNKDSAVGFTPFMLRRSSEIYHYDGFELPGFGDAVGKVIYLCGFCAGKHETPVELQRALDTQFVKCHDKSVSELLWGLVAWGEILENLKFNKVRQNLDARRIGALESRELKELFKKVFNNLASCNKKRREQWPSEKDALELIAPLKKIFSPAKRKSSKTTK